MINLLPPETKKQIRAARINVILYRYCLLIVITAALLGTVFGVGFWASINDKQAADAAKSDSLAAEQQFAKTKTQAQTFASNLATDKTILNSNVSFYQLILNIAALVPSGVILNNLTLGNTSSTPNAPIDISGRATSYNTAIGLKSNLEKSPIFENVNIVNISQSDTSTPGTVSPLVQQYPFMVSLKAQFTKKATTGGGQ